MTNCTVSIVIPTKNGEGRLPLVLDGLRDEMRRSKTAAEVIVVDDRSTDATLALLQAYARDWPALRILEGAGRGPGAARNVAVRHAVGDLVAFADDDDLWTPGRLERQLRAHNEHRSAVFSLTDYAHLRTATPAAVLPSAFAYWPLWRRFRGSDVTCLDDARPLIAAENAVGTSTVMVRRDSYLQVGGFDESLPSASDWDLWLRLAGTGDVLVLGMEGVTYAIREGSVSTKRAARIDAMRTILARHTDLPGWSIRAAKARIADGLSEAAEAETRFFDALGHELAALGWRPCTNRTRRCVGLGRRAVALSLTAASRRSPDALRMAGD